LALSDDRAGRGRPRNKSKEQNQEAEANATPTEDLARISYKAGAVVTLLSVELPSLSRSSLIRVALHALPFANHVWQRRWEQQ